MDTQVSVSEIIETLQQQAVVYNSLLELGTEKTPIIVGNLIPQLNEVTLKERKLSARAEELEKERIRLTKLYFVQLGFARSRTGRLADLIKAINNPHEKSALQKLHAELRKLLQELKLRNETNQLLIRQSLEFIRFSVDLLVDDPNDGVVYRHPMNQSYNQSRRGLFDTRY